MGTCRCGHGRGSHYRRSGKRFLPCQALVRVTTQTRTTMTRCSCRDYVLPGGKTQWGGRTKQEA